MVFDFQQDWAMTPLLSWAARTQPLVQLDFYLNVWNLQKYQLIIKKASLVRAKIPLKTKARNQFLKLRLSVYLPFQLSDGHAKKSLKKHFGYYLCLDLHQAQYFCQCQLLIFPVLSSRNSVSKRSQGLGIRPQTCTIFNQQSNAALTNWEIKYITQT